MSRGNHFVCDLWWLMLSLEPLLLACRIINWSRLLLFHEGTFFSPRRFILLSFHFSSFSFPLFFLVCSFARHGWSHRSWLCVAKNKRKKVLNRLISHVHSYWVFLFWCRSIYVVDLIRSLRSIWIKDNNWVFNRIRKLKDLLPRRITLSQFMTLFLFPLYRHLSAIRPSCNSIRIN